jgi:transposase-like protein
LRSPPAIAELSQTNDFEEECILYLVHLRWPQVLACLRCGGSRTFGFDRQARKGRVRHLYECLDCRYQFSPTTGTIFHNSHLSLTKWFLAIERICSADRRVAAKQLQRELRVTYETAWNVLRRIRQTMLKDEEFRQKFSGIGEIWRPIGEAEPDKPLNPLLGLRGPVVLQGSPLRAAGSQK